MAGSATSQKSVQDAKKRLQKFLRKIDTVSQEVLEEEAILLYGEIIAEVPYKEGTLERSVRVKVSKDKRRPGLNASASARSPEGYNYAGLQHERTDFKHPVKGKDHFISDPFARSTERIKQKMQSRLKMD